MAVSYRRDQTGGNPRFVARITLVKGIPFYGYHVGYRFYLKIYLFNPLYMTRLADLLQQGVILKQKFQPFEAHLQYVPQFMTDYNLYGCDYLDATQLRFRAPIPERTDDSVDGIVWDDKSIASHLITDDIALPRVSHCSLEVDICVQDIRNRTLVKARPIHHDFIELRNPTPTDAKLVHSMAGLWRDETVRRKRALAPSAKNLSPFPPEVHVSMSAESGRLASQHWLHEEEFREQVEQLLIKDEGKTSSGRAASLRSFVKTHPLEHIVNTALESVEDLYPNNLLPALGLPSNVPPSQDPSCGIEVDEKMARQSQSNNLGLNLPQTEENEAELYNAASDWTKYAGVCVSGLKTGKLPQMPILPAFINAVEDCGYISRAAVSVGKGKRGGTSSTAASQTTQGIKRHKNTPPSSESRAPSSKRARQNDNTPPKNKEHLSVPPSPQTIKFPIVKDQNDPYTKYRLSQLSRLGSSQQSMPESQSPKVSFSELLPGPIPSVASKDSFLASSQIASDTSRALTVAFNPDTARRALIFAFPPPKIKGELSFESLGIPDVIYQDAYYSNEKDVPPRNREYAGREFHLESNTLPFLPDFDPEGSSSLPLGKTEALESLDQALTGQRQKCSWRTWEFQKPPPSRTEVEAWMEAELKPKSPSQAFKSKRKRFASQIDGPTPRNKHGFKYTQARKSKSVQHQVQYMSTMSLEVHINTRGKLVPNPEEDEIQCIFWACKGDDASDGSQGFDNGVASGILVLDGDSTTSDRIRKMVTCDVISETTELDLLTSLSDVVRALDPDVLTGYEVHGGSWGYLIERARLKFDLDLCDDLSRMKTDSHGRFGKQSDRWGFNTTSTIRVTGRHMINIWRAMRSELGLLQYTLENVSWHLLHLRTPHFAFRTLTNWYKSGKTADLSKVLRYYNSRAKIDLDILEANELIPRTSEQARLLGVDFFSVFSRGSQFKVESIMFRIAKPENFILTSPSKKQVGSQNALECIPLVMEPQSAFYSSPVLVLDFQSLYPSVMIAYNYCYSTFLGRIMGWRGTSKMGFTDYKRQQGVLSLLRDHINIAPNGIMFAKTQVRKSLLAKMLTEILETRVMVKSGMKQDKDDRMLQQLLNNRQLALKLLANVTYGYTSASFSGRMPCSEIADSIVQTGRETLERAIAFIHSVERWGAEVVYGDTDSLFIHLKGRTKDEAFRIGNEIAEAVTKANPRPVKLKFEKVYLPCVLLAKKRYVGYMYETKDQKTPVFDAKGIETVRRDGTPAEQKIEEKALRMLFETADLSQIKAYFQYQCEKVMRGNVSVQDFCFAREVRLGTYSDKGPAPAGALISTRRMLEDARAEPQYGERVPYVVVTGAPGARLIDRCVAPEDLLANPHWQLDAEYYISKNLIPPLDRIFNLVGASVRQWYDEMPKVQRIRQHVAGGKRSTLESYMKSTSCPVCGVKFTEARAGDRIGVAMLCRRCRSNSAASLLALESRLRDSEKRYQELQDLCRSCTGHAPLEDVRCDSKDCPVFWSRMKQKNNVVSEREVVLPIIRGLNDEASMADLEW